MSEEPREPAEPASTPIIEVRDVTKRFGDVEVLKGVSFAVRRGETLCILGGSGGGKSTLLQVMIGVLRPTSGQVLIEGEDICCMRESEIDRIRKSFGVMFQSGALLNSLSIAQNVALPLEYHTDLDAETIDTMVKIKLHQVDLLHAADRTPSEISGGMQKRAAVARALALDPKIIFYDEPSAGLDPIATTRLDQLINQLEEAMQMTNVVVTHVLESARRIAEHVIMLDGGEVVLDGTIEDLETSTDPRVQQFREGDLAGPATRPVDTLQFMEDLLH